jgi:hypothetical protein
MKPRTIYIVTSGEYSDYSIEAVFSTRADAELYLKQPGFSEYAYPTIEEWEMDSLSKSLHARYVNYFVRMAKDGETLETWTKPLDQPIFKRQYGFDISNNLIMDINATSKEHAIKIANETRTQIIANNSWGKPAEDV